jgi:hypothetical protein
LKPFIPNRAELLSARVRWGDEERGDEERGDEERRREGGGDWKMRREGEGPMGRWGDWENFYFSVLPSSFFLLLPSSIRYRIRSSF